MATLDLEENEEENFGQCTETEIQSKQEIDCNQLTSHLSKSHTHQEDHEQTSETHIGEEKHDKH